jgi:CPA1 family monovalent cation:H+ antiporter
LAPPDAAAATAVLRQLRPPHRLLVILEGESLFNDASALLIYRLAVGAGMGAVVAGWEVVPTLLLVSAGSIVLGLVLSRISLFVTARITTWPPRSSSVHRTSACGCWPKGPISRASSPWWSTPWRWRATRRLMPARIGSRPYAVWEVAVFVLNVLAFIWWVSSSSRS